MRARRLENNISHLCAGWSRHGMNLENEQKSKVGCPDLEHPDSGHQGVNEG